MYEFDFIEAKLGKRLFLDTDKISFEQKKFPKIMNKETKFVDENYQVPPITDTMQ